MEPQGPPAVKTTPLAGPAGSEPESTDGHDVEQQKMMPESGDRSVSQHLSTLHRVFSVNILPFPPGLINALTNAQPGQASVWTCGGCPVSIRNITEALLTNDVERHTADGMERTANLSGMIPVFLIRHV